MLQLRPYQQESVNAVYEYLRNRDGNPAIVCPTGAGKSHIIAQICSDAVSLWSGRVLILAHVKELLEQNAEKVRGYLGNDLVGIYSAGLKQRNMHQSVIAASIQSIYKKAYQFEPFDLVIVDECFPAGTRVSTPRGNIAIEDLYVGQPVHTALGVGAIEAISARNTTKLIELEFEDGNTIRCTPNHPFFTECGWKSAQTLAVGSCLFSREDLLALRSDHATQNIPTPGRESEKLPCGNGVECDPVLLTQVRSSEEEKTACLPPSQNPPMEEPKDTNGPQTVPLLREHVSSPVHGSSGWNHSTRYERISLEKAAFLLDLLCQESGESHVDSPGQRKGLSNSQGDRTRSGPSRGEWPFDRTAATPIKTRLKKDWYPEYVVVTDRPWPKGMPKNIKLDIANPHLQIAIEIDGNSHATISRRKADKRQMEFLLRKGWSVLRLSNAKALQLCSIYKSKDTLLTTLMGYLHITAT